MRIIYLLLLWLILLQASNGLILEWRFRAKTNSCQEISTKGWTVIQQRINGEVDFYKNWTEYKNGFGDFSDGDFFLGLEKIHRLTSEQPNELNIHMEYFNGTTIFARYDSFEVASEEDQYRITKLGKFCGNTANRFRSHKRMRFSTPDRDNDNHKENCASFNHDGWWYDHCAACNLNGKYFAKEVLNPNSVHCDKSRRSLKHVRMMIRPKTA